MDVAGLNIPILFNDDVPGTPPTVAHLKTNGIFIAALGVTLQAIAVTEFRVGYYDS